MKYFNLNSILGRPSFLFERFHARTNNKKSLPETDSKEWPAILKKTYFKGYSRLNEVKLPFPSMPDVSLRDALLMRRSSRNFRSDPLLLQYVHSLLYFSAGLRIYKYPMFSARFYPSAGGRYPLEVYLISLNIKGLSRGIFHYYLKTHCLEELMLFNKIDLDKYFGQKWIKRSAGILIITAIFKRTVVKYRDRGYRYILIEAGHLAQNIYLNSAALNIGCCAVGGFIEEELNNLLDIDGLNESVIYALSLGQQI